MYLYVIFVVLALLSIGEVCNLRVNKSMAFYKYAYVGILIVVFLLSMLRWENGTDWDPYYEYFNIVAANPDSGYMEPGFTWLCHIDSLFMNYTWHLGVIALLCILPVAKRVREFSPFPVFSLLIWFSVSFAHMFPVRQTIAISLFVFSWKYIQERRLLPYLCLLALAATFHVTVFSGIWNPCPKSKVPAASAASTSMDLRYFMSRNMIYVCWLLFCESYRSCLTYYRDLHLPWINHLFLDFPGDFAGECFGIGVAYLICPDYHPQFPSGLYGVGLCHSRI